MTELTRRIEKRFEELGAKLEKRLSSGSSDFVVGRRRTGEPPHEEEEALTTEKRRSDFVVGRRRAGEPPPTKEEKTTEERRSDLLFGRGSAKTARTWW